MRARVDVLDDRQRRHPPLQAGHGLGQPVGGVAHQRRMRRHAHRQLDRLAHATFGQHRQRGIDRSRMATDHDLPWRVEIGRDHDLGAGGGFAHLGHQRIIGAQDGRHRTGSGRRGVLHQLPADPHQVGTVMQRQRSGRDQRGVLAQAVASKYVRRRTTAGLPCTPHRHPCGKQCRLGVFGAVEQFFRAALRQRPQVDAGTGRGFLEGRLHAGMQFREFGQHPDRLRALAGEDQGELCGGFAHAGSGAGTPMESRDAHDTSNCSSPSVPGRIGVARGSRPRRQCAVPVRADILFDASLQALRDRPASAMRAFAHPALACCAIGMCSPMACSRSHRPHERPLAGVLSSAAAPSPR